MDSRDHPVLQVPSRIQHNGTVDEFSYALRAGYTPDVTGEHDTWFVLPRTTRATIVASMRLKDIESALTQIDSRPYWDRYWEAYEARKPKRKGGR